MPFSYAHFGFPSGSFKIEGQPPYQPGQEPDTVYFSVSPDYFKAMGIQLLRGRLFTEQDTKGAPRVAIINATMARDFFAGEDPIGKRLHVNLGATNDPEVYRDIIGIVADVKHRMDQETNWPQTYEPFSQQPFPFMTLVVRTPGDPGGLTEAIREEVLKLDKEQPIFSIATLDRLVSTSTEQQQFSVLLLGVFAAVAVVLAAVGLYGVMSYGVSQRTHEIGIRMALGAQREHVLGLIMRQGIKLTLSGIAFGLLAAWMVTRLLTVLLYGVSVTDPLTFVGISLLLISVALLACYLPARRATRVDPMVATARLKPMADSTRETGFRFWLWLIQVIGVIVPRGLRAIYLPRQRLCEDSRNPTHGSGWIVQVQPTNEGGSTASLNPTHGSGWIVQVQPTKRVGRRPFVLSSLSLAARRKGQTKSENPGTLLCRLDLNDPPTAVGGIRGRSERPPCVGRT